MIPLITLRIGAPTRLKLYCCRSVATAGAKQPARRTDDVVFGTLSESGSRTLAIRRAEKYLPDDADGYDKQEFDLTPRKNGYYYKYEITKHARQGRLGIKKALELFQQMKSQDRLTPTVENFSPLIYGCAKAGYTKRAFELYEESLKYKNRPTRSTVTCLLNACAESPFQEYGLKRLDWFRDHLRIEHNYTLNRIQYHSAIKAYGKLGKLDKASDLVQEMIGEGLTPDTDSFNMLLIGCASDTKSGATIALRVFKRMKLYGLKPNIVTYRLMLRCIRDCGLGSIDLVKKTLGEMPAMTTFDQRLKYKKLIKGNNRDKRKDKLENFEWLPLITDLGSSIESAIKPLSTDQVTSNTNSSEIKLLAGRTKESGRGELPLDNKLPHHEDNSIIVSPFASHSSASLLLPSTSTANHQLPNLLSDDHLELMYRVEQIRLDDLKSGPTRIMLFGGIHGYLATMVRDGCRPDAKTFSLLLSCVKPTKHSQLEYFRLAKDYSIKRDLIFYDLLIRHVCGSSRDKTRLEQGLFFLEEMQKDGLRPNVSTFESLACGCETMVQAEKLLADIKACGFTVSDVLIARLFASAINKTDFRYLNWLISLSREHNFKPMRRLIDALEETRISAHDMILKYEKKKLKADDIPAWLNESFIEQYDKFCKVLGRWLATVDVNEEEHPWSQFYVERTSKRLGFIKFVENFKAKLSARQNALDGGVGEEREVSTTS